MMIASIHSSETSCGWWAACSAECRRLAMQSL